MERLGNHEIGHDYLFTSDQRTLDPATGDVRLRASSPMSRRSTTEVSSPMALAIPCNAPTDVAQSMRLSLGVSPKGAHPGQSGPGPFRTHTVCFPTSRRSTETFAPERGPAPCRGAGRVAWRLR